MNNKKRYAETLNRYCELLHPDDPQARRVITLIGNSGVNECPVRRECGTIVYTNGYNPCKTARLHTRRAFDKLKREGRQAINDLTA